LYTKGNSTYKKEPILKYPSSHSAEGSADKSRVVDLSFDVLGGQGNQSFTTHSPLLMEGFIPSLGLMNEDYPVKTQNNMLRVKQQQYTRQNEGSSAYLEDLTPQQPLTGAKTASSQFRGGANAAYSGFVSIKNPQTNSTGLFDDQRQVLGNKHDDQ
jgi:hypothetical protein